MQREALLAAGIAVLVGASAVVVAVAPGAVAEQDAGDLRPSHLDVEEVAIGAGDVAGGTATLSVTTYLSHRGGDAENVTVAVRAVDAESGLVATTRSADVGRISGDRETPVTVDVPVPREGGYRIEAVLYEDGRRLESVAKAVNGVGTLQSGGRVAFQQFDAGLPPVQYAVEEAADNRTTLDVSTYVTNRGTETSGPVSVELVVRQADSNIVAARTTVDVDGIPAGETATPNAAVTVPSGYNYYLDAILRKDGVVVGTARSAANLDPQERIEANTTVRDVGLSVEDFEQSDTRDSTQRTEESAGESGGGVPGFGPVVALVAVVAAAATAARRRS